ncbi:MAG: DUF4381 domain-containing protein [bacterium]|nr:DUF4381 domain-containing protein [Gammaproteobacteria bacterium]HIL94285.1 DUF4381 domain-containing protein [Pseudomonadales bacterium]
MAANTPQLADPGQADPLAQLRDIHLPGPIESWPPAPGWWLLAILGLCAIAYGLFFLYRQWQKNQYRREGVRALGELQNQYQRNPETVNYLEQFSLLLKRVALSHYSREHVASLTGEAWVAFLDKSGATHDFGMGPGQVLIEGNYSRESPFEVVELHRIGTQWIRNHGAVESSR